MSETILRTKLFIPPLRPLLVPRPRLVDRLIAGLAGRVILVSAPAGFGKTTLVTHWLRQQAEPAAWLSLDEHDNEPQRFFVYLLTAVQTVYPDLGQGLLASLHSTRPPDDEAIMPTLVNVLTDHSEPLLLVLDDYHVIENGLLHEALAFLIDYLPPRVHLIFTSREDPPLPLPRWRVRGQLTEIRAADLRFTPEEATTFLGQTMGLQLEETAVTALENRTEGWVAGLQLAALSLRHAEDTETFIHTFTGSDRQVADYLVQEVLHQQPERVQQFLLKTSILERFNAELSNAVLGWQDSQDLLDELEQSNIFLIPLDNHRFWYRYHHLFSQLLRYQLQREIGDTAVADLHRRAALWYESENLLEEGVSHALQIPDPALAARLAATFPVNSLFQQGGISLIKQWSQALPPDVIRQFPRMGVLAVGAYLITGDILKGQYYLQLIAEETAVRAEYCLFQSIIVRNEHSDYEQALQLAEEAYAGMQAQETSVAVMALMQVAVNHLNLGHLRQAEQKIAEMRQRLQSSEKDLLQIHLQAIHMQAASKISHLDFFQAEQICLEGVELVMEAGPESSPMIGWIYALLARIYYEWNEIPQATRYVEKASLWAERTGISDIFIQSSMVKADLACLVGDLAAVETITQSLKSYAKSSRMDDIIEITEAYSAYYWLKVSQLDTAVRWANASRISLDDDPPFYKFNLYSILATVRLAESRALAEKRMTPKILELIEKLEALALEASFPQAIFEAQILKALTLDWIGRLDEATKALNNCLDLARPGSMMRFFLDYGPPMRTLLARSLDHQPAYVRRLLQAFEGDETAVPGVTAVPEPPVNLTGREMDVLQAIASGLSNKEIEESLFISNNTVRTHLKNLYSKLEVESRTQAILKAQELGLL